MTEADCQQIRKARKKTFNFTLEAQMCGLVSAQVKKGTFGGDRESRRQRSSSSSMDCISLIACSLPDRRALAIPALSRSTASARLPALTSVWADMK